MSGSIRQHEAGPRELALTGRNPPTSPSEAFRRSVVRLRKRYGWRQVDLAERAGLSRDALKRIENDERHITIDEMCAISAALGASPANLIAPGDGADLEILPGDEGQIESAHIVRAWFGGRGWVRSDDLPHMPAALHPDSWERREETSLLYGVQLMREVLALVEPAIDPSSEATAALDERVMALQRNLEETAQAFAQRNARVASRQRIRKAA